MFAGAVLLILGLIFVLMAFATMTPAVSSAVDSAMMSAPMMDPAALAMFTSASVLFFILGTVVTTIADIFIYGVMIRVYRGGELALNHWGKMFVEGMIILFNMIPYIIISTSRDAWSDGQHGIIVGMIIPIILLISLG